MEESYQVKSIGMVSSLLVDPADAPRQGDEGAPEAWLELVPTYTAAARDLTPGEELLVLTWLHLADRSILVTRPRNDPGRPEAGVFSTRSPDRPNPIGLHRVTIIAVELTDGRCRVKVRDLEAVDGTPIIDLKPVLGALGER